MDEPDQNSLSSLSLQQLIEELESFITLESKRNGSPWICIDKFRKFFYGKYGVSPEKVIVVQEGNSDLRGFLGKSGRFSIYRTQVPHQFYVALRETNAPSSQGAQASSISSKVKRSWKTAGRLLNSMKTVGDVQISPDQFLGLSEYRPILVSEIQSTHDLEVALLEIIKSLTGNNPEKFVSIGALTKAFSNGYKQPIRAMMRRVCPDMKLIDLLQSMTILNVQKVDDVWQVSIGGQAID